MLEIQLQFTYALMALVKNKYSDSDIKVYCETEAFKDGVRRIFILLEPIY